MTIVYRMRIIYKSGATIDFEVKSFEIDRKPHGNTYKWDHYGGPKPILLGVDEIAAVYQLESYEVDEIKVRRDPVDYSSCGA
jgi:hypothetical protein